MAELIQAFLPGTLHLPAGPSQGLSAKHFPLGDVSRGSFQSQLILTKAAPALSLVTPSLACFCARDQGTDLFLERSHVFTELLVCTWGNSTADTMGRQKTRGKQMTWQSGTVGVCRMNLARRGLRFN